MNAGFRGSKSHWFLSMTDHVGTKTVLPRILAFAGSTRR